MNKITLNGISILCGSALTTSANVYHYQHLCFDNAFIDAVGLTNKVSYNLYSSDGYISAKSVTGMKRVIDAEVDFDKFVEVVRANAPEGAKIVVTLDHTDSKDEGLGIAYVQDVPSDTKGYEYYVDVVRSVKKRDKKDRRKAKINALRKKAEKLGYTLVSK